MEMAASPMRSQGLMQTALGAVPSNPDSFATAAEVAKDSSEGVQCAMKFRWKRAPDLHQILQENLVASHEVRKTSAVRY